MNNFLSLLCSCWIASLFFRCLYSTVPPDVSSYQAFVSNLFPDGRIVSLKCYELVVPSGSPLPRPQSELGCRNPICDRHLDYGDFEHIVISDPKSGCVLQCRLEWDSHKRRRHVSFNLVAFAVGWSHGEDTWDEERMEHVYDWSVNSSGLFRFDFTVFHHKCIHPFPWD